MLDLKLDDKVVIVTGGAAGIGKAVAKAFLQQGAIVAVCDKNAEKLQETRLEFAQQGYDLDCSVVDICDYQSFAAFVYDVYERYQRLDVFVNNAGGGYFKPLIDYTPEEFKLITDVNYTSVFVGTQLAAKCMKKQQGGVILNGSSFSALIPNAGKAVYSASKAAILNITRSFAAELAADHIRVVSYLPGLIIAGAAEEKIKRMGDKLISEIASHRLGRPEDIANVLIFLASDYASYINGTQIEITGGKFCTQNPNWAFE